MTFMRRTALITIEISSPKGHENEYSSTMNIRWDKVRIYSFFFPEGSVTLTFGGMKKMSQIEFGRLMCSHSILCFVCVSKDVLSLDIFIEVVTLPTKWNISPSWPSKFKELLKK